MCRILFGDYIDDAAHGVRSVKRRHGAANDFDPFDGICRWQEALFEAGVTIGTGITGALAFSINQQQCIGTGKTANEDVFLSGRTCHRNALNILQSVGQVAVGPFSSSSPETTVMLAGASVIFCSKPVAVTTIWLSLTAPSAVVSMPASVAGAFF